MSARQTLPLYLGAFALYVTVGVFLPELLLAWPVGVTYLVVAVWLMPALYRRLR